MITHNNSLPYSLMLATQNDNVCTHRSTLSDTRAEYQITVLNALKPMHCKLTSTTTVQHSLVAISQSSTNECMRQLASMDKASAKHFMLLAEHSFDVVKQTRTQLAQLELGQARLLIALAKSGFI